MQPRSTRTPSPSRAVLDVLRRVARALERRDGLQRRQGQRAHGDLGRVARRHPRAPERPRRRGAVHAHDRDGGARHVGGPIPVADQEADGGLPGLTMRREQCTRCRARVRSCLEHVAHHGIEIGAALGRQGNGRDARQRREESHHTECPDLHVSATFPCVSTGFEEWTTGPLSPAPATAATASAPPRPLLRPGRARATPVSRPRGRW